MARKKVKETRECIRIVKHIYRDITMTYSWKYVESALRTFEGMMVYCVNVGVLLRLDEGELQEWNPADREWHETLLTYNEVAQGGYKFCEFLKEAKQ